MRSDRNYKDPRRCEGWAGCIAMEKYGRVVIYRLFVRERLYQLTDPSTWSAAERAFMEKKAERYRDYGERWHGAASTISEQLMPRLPGGSPDFQAADDLCDELIGRQNTITPEMCAEATMDVLSRAFRSGEKLDYQLVLLAGLIFTYQYLHMHRRGGVPYTLAAMMME